MANIRKRQGPNGRVVWQVQIRKHGYPSQTKTFDRKIDAEGWARKVEHEMDTSTWRDTSDASRVTLAEALDRYQGSVTPRKRPTTQRRDKLSIAHLKTGLGKFSLLQITPEKVARYRDERLKKLSPDSVRIELALLSNLFRIAEREWSFRGLENPVSKIEKPRVPEGRAPMLNEKEIERLLDECKRSRTKLLYPFVLLALHTGARSLELRGLRWAQMNLKDGFMSLAGAETKGKRTRTVPLTDAAVSVLKELAERRGEGKVVDLHGKAAGLVFPARGNPNAPRDMHGAFDRAVKRAGLDSLPGAGKLRIHDLRHLCGSYLLMSGVDLRTIQRTLGHADISTTMRYLHLVDIFKREQVQKIGHLGISAAGEIE